MGLMSLLTPPRWPVIAVIIIGGLILISIIWCIARCLCCGLSCCCECCSFLKCCGNCCGCCDSPRKQKYLDEPYIPPHQGYRSEPVMSAGAIPPQRPTAKAADPPQYAQFASFDISKKEEGEDSLPAMPTWEDSERKKVVLEEEVVELQQLNKPEANGQGQPPMNGRSPPPGPGANTPVGPGGRSPYGPQGNHAAAGGHMGPGPGALGGPHGTGAMPNPYAMQQGPGFNQMHNGYAQPQAYHTEQSWGVTGGQDYGQMPGPSPSGYEQPGYFEQGAYSEYGATGNGPVPPGINQPYGIGAEPQQPQPQRRGPPRGAIGAVGGDASVVPDRSLSSPAPQQQQQQQQQEAGFVGGQFDQGPLTYSPTPVQGAFPPAPDRAFSPAPQRSFSPAPQRTFSPAPPQQAFPPAPQRTFSPAPQRTFSPAPQRQFSPAPQRQFSADSAPAPGRGPMPPRGPPGSGSLRGPPGSEPPRGLPRGGPPRGPPGVGPPRGAPRGTPYRQFSADSAPNPQRQFSGDSVGRPLVGGLAGRPPPRRNFTADAGPAPSPSGSPNPQNNAGFDLQSGYTRPSRANTFDDSINDNNNDAGGNQAQQQPAAYPGYKPYQPAR